MMVVGVRSWFRQPSMMQGIEIQLRPEYPQPPIWSRDNKVGVKVLMFFSRLVDELSPDEVDSLVAFRRRVIAPITTSLVSSTNLKRGGRVNP